MSKTTPKLGLILPGGGSTGLNMPPDRVDIDVLNGNFDKIDANAVATAPYVEDTGWVAITPGTNWTASSNGYAPRVRRIGKLVLVHGLLNYAAGASYANLGKVGPDFLPFTNGAPDVYAGFAVATEQTSGTAAFGSLAVKPDGTLMFMPNYATKISNNLSGVMMNGVWTKD